MDDLTVTARLMTDEGFTLSESLLIADALKPAEDVIRERDSARRFAVDLEQQLARVVEFCEWLTAMDDPANEQGREDRRVVTLTAIIERAAAVLAEVQR